MNVARPPGGGDVAVDGAGLLDRVQVLARDGGDGVAADFLDQFGMARDERGHIVRRCRLPDGAGDIERVEIAGVDEAVHGAEIDVVGVHVVGKGPAERAYRGIGGAADGARFTAHDQVLAIGFIPDRNHVHPAGGSHAAGLELGFGLVGEAVAHTERVFFQRKHGVCATSFYRTADVSLRIESV